METCLQPMETCLQPMETCLQPMETCLQLMETCLKFESEERWFFIGISRWSTCDLTLWSKLKRGKGGGKVFSNYICRCGRGVLLLLLRGFLTWSQGEGEVFIVMLRWSTC